MRLELNWWKCVGSQWCSLDEVNLSSITIGGVYLIWYAGSPGRWVYVGQGQIRERLEEHRQSPAIGKYRQYGSLFASWAMVDPEQRDGVERFLAEACSPLEGKIWPEVPPIEVNLPQ